MGVRWTSEGRRLAKAAGKRSSWARGRARRTRNLARLGVLAATGVATASCLFLPRHRSIAPARGAWPDEALARSMNPWLLAEGFSDRLEIEIDWVEGCKPGPKTVEGLRRIALEYGPAGQPVEITLDDEIPLKDWKSAGPSGDDPEQKIVERYADLLGAPEDAEFRTARLYVLFAPESRMRGLNGYSTRWIVPRGGDRADVDGIVVYRAPHERYAKLWLSRDKMERMTLIHEFGHELGLVGNEAHERLEPYSGHCTSLKCLMALPSLRVLFRNAIAGFFNILPTDYCARCREDIRRAKATWREAMARDASYRESRVAERWAARLALSLEPLREQGRHEEVLEAIGRFRSGGGMSQSLRRLKIGSLAALGRLDEARMLLDLSDPDDRLRLSWSLGRSLTRVGRYEEAASLFDRDELRRARQYEFEQSCWVLLAALDGAGRPQDAVSLLEELIARGRAISFHPFEGLRVRRAQFLRKAGRMEEALGEARKALRERKGRAYWRELAAELLDESGSKDEARALRHEWLSDEEHALARAKEPVVSWELSWRVARVRALLGETAEARATIAQGGAAPEGTGVDRRLWTEAPALATLGDWDAIAALIRRQGADSFYDTCLQGELAPMRADSRYADLFSVCPEHPMR